MSAPAFVLEAETVFNTAITPKTTAAFNVLQGDVLVAYSITDFNGTTVAISNSGVALAWTLQQSVVITNFCWVGLWTHVVTQSRASVTVSFTATGGGFFGGNVLLIRGSAGVGASSKTNGTGAPSLNLTTTRTDSLIVVANGDFDALATARTWLTGAGALTEVTYNSNANMTAYGGYHASAGPIGTYAVGLSAPTPQSYSIVAVEVFGLEPPLVFTPRHLRLRG
jgi:hypothetical protein